MLSAITRIPNVCYILVIIMCFVVSHARPTSDDSNNVEDVVLDHLRERVVQRHIQQNKHDLKNLGLEDVLRNDKHIPVLKDISEIPKTRRKRVGFAGLENLDMIISTLGRNRNRHNRFQPALSISGSFGDLRSMMQKAG